MKYIFNLKKLNTISIIIGLVAISGLTNLSPALAQNVMSSKNAERTRCTPSAEKPCSPRPEKSYNNTQKAMLLDYKEKTRPKIEALRKEHKDLLGQKEKAKTPEEKAKLEVQATTLREKRIAFKKEFKEFKEKLDKAK